MYLIIKYNFINSDDRMRLRKKPSGSNGDQSQTSRYQLDALYPCSTLHVPSSLRGFLVGADSYVIYYF